jgi:hypothetical protein
MRMSELDAAIAAYNAVWEGWSEPIDAGNVDEVRRAAMTAALAAQQDGGRREGFKHLYTLSESEVIVAHPNFNPVIYDFETGSSRILTDPAAFEQGRAP